MGMTIKTDGLDELSKMLSELGDKAESVASKALYKGAGVMADAIRSEANAIKAEPQQKKKRPPEKTPARWPTPEEKAAVVNSIGIAKFNKNGSEVDTLIGIASGSGYSSVGKGEKRKAVRLIGRSINSGTSFMHKQPFVRKAVAKAREAAKAAIVAEAEAQIAELTKK